MFEQILHFRPILKSVIWGGDRIAAFKRIRTDRTHIGESWEVSAVPGHESVVDRGPYRGHTLTELMRTFGPELVGERVYRRTGDVFPLLIKLIDARADLSVQVHPDDTLACKRHNSHGKTEMWRIIETNPDARIHVGLSGELTPQLYDRHVADGTIMDVVKTYASAPGDVYFLPPGRIHAIGAGNFLAEIQETSDITYRIFDYNRRDSDGNLRPLHTDQARDAIDYTQGTPCRLNPQGDTLVSCEPFDVREVHTTGTVATALPHPRTSFTVVMCIGGHARLSCRFGDKTETADIACGDTLLFPATATGISAAGDADLLSIQA